MIDLSKLVTAEDKAAAAQAARADTIKAACRDRILTVVGEIEQINLAAAAAADALTQAQRAVYLSGFAWIREMQATARALAADPATDHTDDSAWPSVPEGVVELVAEF